MSDGFLKTFDETKAWLDKMGVTGYTIRNDLTVNAAGNVDISSKKLMYIPVRFGTIKGTFNCSNNHLTSLSGSPSRCWFFDCEHNQLTSLDGAPKMVSGWFDCEYNQLTSLLGAPRKCTNFYCGHNQLASLDGAPVECESFHCAGNQLTNLIGSPKKCENFFDCRGNQLISLIGVPDEFGHIDCTGNPHLADISAVADGCEIEYDHDVIVKNRAASQFAELGAGNDVSSPSAKLGRTL